MNTQYPPEMAAGAWQELLAEAALQAAKDKPWLLKLLAAQGGRGGVAALVGRYTLWKERLARLRPGERRRLRRRLGVSLAGAALLLALAATPGLGAPSAAAPLAAITVTNGTGTIANGDGCSLPEAIINANANNQSGSTDCTAGAAGLDTITLNTNVTLTASHNSTFGYTGLPVVTSAITIQGGGFTISRSSASNFRIMAVGSGGTLTLNSATVSGGGVFGVSGGGIAAYSATVAVSNSTLSGNSAGSGGGGIYARSATLAVSNSTLSGNSAGGSAGGGGIAATSARLTVSNSTLSGNSANGPGGGGGGIRATSATVTVSNSTLSGNSASTGGGINARISAVVTLQRSLVSGNGAGTDREVTNSSSTITAASFNLFGHNGETNAQAFSGFTPSGSDIIATSDGATPTALAGILNTTLVSNGGPTKTHALVVGGPAVDASPDAGCPSTDQRGIARPVDVNPSGPAGTTCDIGAFEIQSVTAVGLLGMAAVPGGPGAGWWAVLLAGLGGLGLSAFVARRRSWRRRDSGPTPSLLLSAPAAQPAARGSVSPPACAPPAITQRSHLRQFSGSPLAVDPLNLSE